MRQPIRCFEGLSKPHEAFWQVRNAVEGDPNSEPEVELYGYISEYSWFEDDVTPKKFKTDLYDLGVGGPVTVRINSGGGDVIAASVIRTILKDYPGKITVKIDGLAASAAVVVAMAGDRVMIQDTAYMMIHDPAIIVFLAMLDIETLAGLHSELKAIKTGISDTYAARTGISSERINRMMADETWMNASEAVKLGFADEVIGATSNSQTAGAAVVNALPALRNYVNVPAALAALAEAQAQQPEPVNAAQDAQETITPEAARFRDEVKLLR